jgi:hypothetical protein
MKQIINFYNSMVAKYGQWQAIAIIIGGLLFVVASGYNLPEIYTYFASLLN